MSAKSQKVARARAARLCDAFASRSGVIAAAAETPAGMRGPPQTPQTQVRLAPSPFGSTRAMALQCGQRFASPLGVPHRPQIPSTTASAPQAEHFAGDAFTPPP
jgi:hypothetical protein